MDLFAPVWRSRNANPGKNGVKSYHLTPDCPFLRQQKTKGRLGAALAAGMKLCPYEQG